MKTKIILFILCLASLNVMGQGTISRQKRQQQKTQTTHKPTQKPTQQSKPTVKMCDICEQPLSKCDYGGKHPYCQTCGKLKERCEYRGNHSTTVSQSDTATPSSNLTQTTVSQPTGYISGHGYVDLGLSVKWATCNVGASSPSDYGGYYAWGEIDTKSLYYWENCFDCLDGAGNSWRTYKLGGQARITPTSGHDTARENWGSTWRMPTDAENEELCKKCKWTWTSKNGHNGYVVTGPNGNSIFLPAAGYRNGSDSLGVGSNGNYWSSTLSSSNSRSVRYLYLNSSYHTPYFDTFRSFGQSVRPVTE